MVCKGCKDGLVDSVFSDEPKLINRNENIYKCGRMEEFAVEMAVGFLNGRVRSSLKDRTYSVEVSFRIVDCCVTMLGHWYRMAPINECVPFVVHFVCGLNIVFTI